MQPSEFLPHFADSFAARRVYSEPYENGGTTIITAAAVSGGGGIGQHASEKNSGDSGGGMGLYARPVGAYVLRQGRVVWKPAFDLSRIALRGQLVAISALLIVGIILGRRRSH